MRVFVAGATGVIGRPLVGQLVLAGHDVVGSTRSASKGETLREQGAEAVVMDALDPESVHGAIASAEPEVVIHQLTALPERLDPRRVDRDLAVTNRLRREATRHLVAAAVDVGARRLIAQSVAFIYEPGPPHLRTEADPIYVGVPKRFTELVAAAHALEAATLETPGLEGVVLRYGLFYGPGTYYAPDGAVAADVRRRRFPIVGKGTGITCFIHVDDAASATVAALDHGPVGIYNIVDDEPAPVSEWLPAYADALGAPPPRRVPGWLGRLVGGAYAYYLSVEAPGASNEKASSLLEWRPSHTSWREGFAEMDFSE